jgi:hypothetical protein
MSGAPHVLGRERVVGTDVELPYLVKGRLQKTHSLLPKTFLCRREEPAAVKDWLQFGLVALN